MKVVTSLPKQMVEHFGIVVPKTVEEYHEQLRKKGEQIRLSRPPSPANLPPKAEEALPVEKWPLWAKAIAAQRQLGEVGVGDTVERIAGKFGGAAFKIWFKATFGKDCGCDKRKENWNTLFKYDVAES